MRVVGLVVEYNPFHNGHLHHLRESLRVSGAEFVVCVMSGNFIQRGEPAVVNKWARTRMALANGVDLVVELPVAYATASAEYFAYGAVKILDSTGIVSDICFGSENGRIEELDLIADVLVKEPEAFKRLLKEQLGSGVSFPVAREAALKLYFQQQLGSQGPLDELMGSSNNILGIEYLKALKRLNSPIRPVTIPRVANQYNAEEFTGNISSATSIRKYLVRSASGSCDTELYKVMPKESCEILKEEFEIGRGPVFMDAFSEMVLHVLRRMSLQQIKELPYVSEGLENRIKEAAAQCGSLEDLVDKVATRRYPKTRIQRIFTSLLTGLTAADLESLQYYGGPQYIRVLGFNPKGRQLLTKIRANATLPLVVKAADVRTSCNPLVRKMMEMEAAATDAYVLGYGSAAERKAGQEFTQNIIRM